MSGRVARERSPQPDGEHGVDVAWSPQPRIGDAQLVELHVERIGVLVVQPDEGRVDPALAQSGQEGQQVPLRATDAAEPVHVDDLHTAVLGARRAWAAFQSRTAPNAAGTQSRKFHGAL